METMKADIDAQVVEGMPMAMAARVRMTNQIHLPYVSASVWSAFPRRWVGIVGLICSLLMAALWVYSSLSYEYDLVGEYGRDGQPDASAFPDHQ
jgi:hypothetical protein